MCVSVIPVPLDLAEASRLATSAVGSSSSDAPHVPGAAPEPRPPQWVMRDVQWVECPCRQQWKCAHAGSLLWVVLLWCVARYSAHIDNVKFYETAGDCWWLQLDPRVVAARRTRAHCRAGSSTTRGSTTARGCSPTARRSRVGGATHSTTSPPTVQNLRAIRIPSSSGGSYSRRATRTTTAPPSRARRAARASGWLPTCTCTRAAAGTSATLAVSPARRRQGGLERLWTATRHCTQSVPQLPLRSRAPKR